MPNINPKFKSSVFADFFGNEQYKDNLLSLFNALNNTNYSDAEALEITTIDNVIYMGIKNDVSCIIDNYMSLIEHQSTFNPNMPLRGLMYFGKLYGKYIAPNKEDIYLTTLLKVPTPQYFVLYNGSRQQPDVVELRLSDAFIRKDKDHRYEWTAIMLNINPGYNEKLVNSCKALKEYTLFVDKVKHYLSKGLSIDIAADKAVDDCIANNIMKDYLLKNKAGVIDMCLTEFDEEKYKQRVAQEIERLSAEVAQKNALLADKDALIAKEKEENSILLKEIEALKAKLAKNEQPNLIQ